MYFWSFFLFELNICTRQMHWPVLVTNIVSGVITHFTWRKSQQKNHNFNSSHWNVKMPEISTFYTLPQMWSFNHHNLRSAITVTQRYRFSQTKHQRYHHQHFMCTFFFLTLFFTVVGRSYGYFQCGTTFHTYFDGSNLFFVRSKRSAVFYLR